MKQIKCEACGSVDIIKKDGYYQCEYCGCKYDTEEVKKLVVDISGSNIKIDNTDEINNLMVLLKRAVNENDFINIRLYADKILQKDAYNVYAYSCNLFLKQRITSPNNFDEKQFYNVCYSQLNNKLKQFYKEINKQELIELSAILFFKVEQFYDEKISRLRRANVNSNIIVPFINKRKNVRSEANILYVKCLCGIKLTQEEQNKFIHKEIISEPNSDWTAIIITTIICIIAIAFRPIIGIIFSAVMFIVFYQQKIINIPIINKDLTPEQIIIYSVIGVILIPPLSLITISIIAQLIS